MKVERPLTIEIGSGDYARTIIIRATGRGFPVKTFRRRVDYIQTIDISYPGDGLATRWRKQRRLRKQVDRDLQQGERVMQRIYPKSVLELSRFS